MVGVLKREEVENSLTPITGRMPVPQYLLLTGCQFHNTYYWQDASSTILITGRMLVPQYLLLAGCQFHNTYYWQDASSTILVTGRMPVPQYLLLAGCQFHITAICLLLLHANLTLS
ncbi:MAG: hypothetical protein F6K41_13785 [Symploca sp. SIO3E6]|nr:hypothetical protein [Caldora sp. SIO3E6]